MIVMKFGGSSVESAAAIERADISKVVADELCRQIGRRLAVERGQLVNKVVQRREPSLVGSSQNLIEAALRLAREQGHAQVWASFNSGGIAGSIATQPLT